jgi:transcription-repair coupling factor (superfamily II helicase)
LAETASNDLFAKVLESPAVQTLARRLEHGSVLSLDGISQAAQPFLAAVINRLFPKRHVVLVADGLKTQESFHQDLQTWLRLAAGESANGVRPAGPLFYPAWETLPHEARLPHSDVISDRLETLIALSHSTAESDPPGRILVTSVLALLQRTFSPAEIRKRNRTITRGEVVEPLDLVEWLEDQGYEPEAQVTQKGELSLRGGILDLFPLTSPWPIRIEFFGDEIESLREFDPLTQISRQEIPSVVVSPAGELGVLKRLRESSASQAPPAFATLLDYLPPQSIVLACDPARLEERAGEYQQQVPANDSFFISWKDFQQQASAGHLLLLGVNDTPGSESIPATGRTPPRGADRGGSAPGILRPASSLGAPELCC